MSGLGKKKTSVKICRDENGQIIKTNEGILYEYVDNDGNTTLKFLPTTHPFCSESSSSTSVESESIMPCSTTASTTQENNCNKNVEKLVIAHDFLLSSSDSSNEELQYTCLVQKKRMLRVKHYIKNIVDQYIY
ncbi:uncharacterized protein LOC143906340 [Temnothorax americanus]|uniref:uncharacterized protein LOC143906340 n=1 Tax=Temnothorax americanus TaxID=1964332 RepID=UPI0040681DF3